MEAEVEGVGLEMGLDEWDEEGVVFWQGCREPEAVFESAVEAGGGAVESGSGLFEGEKVFCRRAVEEVLDGLVFGRGMVEGVCGEGLLDLFFVEGFDYSYHSLGYGGNCPVQNRFGWVLGLPVFLEGLAGFFFVGGACLDDFRIGRVKRVLGVKARWWWVPDPATGMPAISQRPSLPVCLGFLLPVQIAEMLGNWWHVAAEKQRMGCWMGVFGLVCWKCGFGLRCDRWCGRCGRVRFSGLPVIGVWVVGWGFWVISGW